MAWTPSSASRPGCVYAYLGQGNVKRSIAGMRSARWPAAQMGAVEVGVAGACALAAMAAAVAAMSSHDWSAAFLMGAAIVAITPGWMRWRDTDGADVERATPTGDATADGSIDDNEACDIGRGARSHAMPIPGPAMPPRQPGRSVDRDLVDRAGDESLAALTHRMQHDLRTPLNAVIGFSQLLEAELHGPFGNERYRSYVSHIRESGQRLLRATETTLTVTRAMAEQRPQSTGPFCVEACISSAISQLADGRSEAAQAPFRRLRDEVDNDQADQEGDSGRTSTCGCQETFTEALIQLLTAVRDLASAGMPIEIATASSAAVGRVMISFMAERPDELAARDATFPTTAHGMELCMARMLFELQNVALVIDARDPTRAQITLSFDAAVQECLEF